MPKETLDQNRNGIARLLSDPSKQDVARERLQQAFAMVPHRRAFLPTYVLRRCVEGRISQNLQPDERLRLLDWASEAMIDWLAKMATDKDHPKRACPPIGVALDFYLEAREVLEELRAGDRQAELIFRLRQVAGCDFEEIGQMLALPAPVAEGFFAAGCALVSLALEMTEGKWDIGLFDLADIRPPQEVTSLLEETGDRQAVVWEALATEKMQQEFRLQSRHIVPGGSETILQESLLRAALSDGPVPENSARLRAYVREIMKNLARDRYRAAKCDQVADEDAFDRLMSESADDTEEVDGVTSSATVDAKRLEKVAGVFNGLMQQLERDQPDLFDVVDVWLLQMPDASELEQAKALEISAPTFKRRKTDVRAFFKKGLEQAGFDLGHYENYPRQKRLENLFQLIENALTVDFGLKKGENYRGVLAQALREMELKDDSSYQLLHDSYLVPSGTPSELAASMKISTKELNRRKAEAKERLTAFVAAIVATGSGV